MYLAIYILLIFIILFKFINPILAKTVTLKNLKVTKVIDGDTIWVKNIYNKSFKIRLLGINAPEISTNPPEPYSFTAKRKLEQLLIRQTVNIEYDTSNKKDKYNRILAHVYRSNDKLWINLELINLGLAYVYIINANIPHLETLINNENNAIINKINIWSHPKYIPISPEQAINFINEYKIIIGKINKIVTTKNNLWLIFEKTNSNFSTKKHHKFINTSINNLNYSNNNILAIKIYKKGNTSTNWQKYLGKTIRVRGYIEQKDPTFIPFINFKNVNTIDIL